MQRLQSVCVQYPSCFHLIWISVKSSRKQHGIITQLPLSHDTLACVMFILEKIERKHQNLWSSLSQMGNMCGVFSSSSIIKFAFASGQTMFVIKRTEQLPQLSDQGGCKHYMSRTLSHTLPSAKCYFNNTESVKQAFREDEIVHVFLGYRFLDPYN